MFNGTSSRQFIALRRQERKEMSFYLSELGALRVFAGSTYFPIYILD
jgi:hypothetical protein